MWGDPDPTLSPEQRAQYSVQDRLVISLNTTRSGLTLKKAACDVVRTISYSIEQYFRRLAMLSLAPGEPTALYTTGQPWSLGSGQSISLSNLNEDRILKFPLLSIHLDNNDTNVELETCDFGSGTTQRGPSPAIIQQAVLLTEKFGRIRGIPRKVHMHNKWETFMSLNKETERNFISTFSLCSGKRDLLS
jgi:hypothetical protein